MAKNLHVLPKFSDRWSYLYLEHGRLDKDEQSLTFRTAEGITRVPIDQLGFLMLGPGTRVTHAAMRELAENNCLVTWTGEQGVRLYAHSTGAHIIREGSFGRRHCSATRNRECRSSGGCTRNASLTSCPQT
jgi:CRISPR/Cas system-associated endonuclease Cas1